VRSVELKLTTGNINRRAIQTLHPTELREGVPECLEALRDPPDDEEEPEDQDQDRVEPSAEMQPPVSFDLVVSEDNPIDTVATEDPLLDPLDTTDAAIEEQVELAQQTVDGEDSTVADLPVPATPPDWMVPAVEDVPGSSRPARDRSRTSSRTRPREPVRTSGSPGEYVGKEVPTSLDRGRSRPSRTRAPPQWTRDYIID